MTFLTVCDAIQLPAVALESVATMMPPLKRKANVVVPWAILIGQFGLEWSSVIARRKLAGRSSGGRANLNDSGGIESAYCSCSSWLCPSCANAGCVYWATRASILEDCLVALASIRRVVNCHTASGRAAEVSDDEWLEKILGFAVLDDGRRC